MTFIPTIVPAARFPVSKYMSIYMYILVKVKTHMRIDLYLYYKMFKYYLISAKHVNICVHAFTVIFIQTYMRID